MIEYPPISTASAGAPTTLMCVLEERFARGEIDADDSSGAGKSCAVIERVRSWPLRTSKCWTQTVGSQCGAGFCDYPERSHGAFSHGPDRGPEEIAGQASVPIGPLVIRPLRVQILQALVRRRIL
jgi:hypothetical protein